MIEVGEYVRTKKGQIDKFEKLLSYEDDKETSIVVCKEKRFWLEDVVKHSSNIIDLIEEGDYVNGKYVYSIGTVIGNLPIINHTDGTFTPSNMIKSLVTKEINGYKRYQQTTM